jgi:hypothetical protein
MPLPTEKEIVEYINDVVNPKEQTIASVNFAAGFLVGAKWLKAIVEKQYKKEELELEPVWSESDTWTT